jgi:hypothetical protein
MRILGVVLVVLGLVALAVGSFSYTKTTADARVGPVAIEVHEKERVNVPVWAGVGAIAVGAVLLLVRRR